MIRSVCALGAIFSALLGLGCPSSPPSISAPETTSSDTLAEVSTLAIVEDPHEGSGFTFATSTTDTTDAKVSNSSDGSTAITSSTGSSISLSGADSSNANAESTDSESTSTGALETASTNAESDGAETSDLEHPCARLHPVGHWSFEAEDEGFPVPFVETGAVGLTFRGDSQAVTFTDWGYGTIEDHERFHLDEGTITFFARWGGPDVNPDPPCFLSKDHYGTYAEGYTSGHIQIGVGNHQYGGDEAIHSLDYRLQTSSPEDPHIWIQSDTDVPIDQWVHVTMTFSPTGTLLYQDGQLVGENLRLTDGIRDNHEPMMVGVCRDGYSGGNSLRHPLTGAIDDISIFDRSLEPEEIEALAHDQCDLDSRELP